MLYLLRGNKIELEYCQLLQKSESLTFDPELVTHSSIFGEAPPGLKASNISPYFGVTILTRKHFTERVIEKTHFPARVF